jgi:hypothetical protein
MTVLIPNLALAGYRSFGPTLQRFDRFAKLNIFIGQNNAGKSNVLRFIQDVYPELPVNTKLDLDPLTRHQPGNVHLKVGIGEVLKTSEQGSWSLPSEHRMLAGLNSTFAAGAALSLAKLMQQKATIDKSGLVCWSVLNLPERAAIVDDWGKALQSLSDAELQSIWRSKNQNIRPSGWSRSDFEITVLRMVPAPFPHVRVKTIPALRRVGERGSVSEEFDGLGIIERLARIERPGALEQASKKDFAAFSEFVRVVLDRPDVQIEIPHLRDTILVVMDGKALPLESLGTGISEVILLAAAATLLKQHVVCIEEPELHLNPILQKKLVRYLESRTDNQYFITTHSAALMDTPNAEVYHVRLDEGCSVVERVTSDHQKSAVCEDLGYHPSDLLQANCVIWVEGPSDRIYLKWWLTALDKRWIEGIHFSIMFYGGRLAAHLSNAVDGPKAIEDFISLRQLNRRGVILIDSDRRAPGGRLNETKKRLKQEFDKGPGHAWITAGREIENYLPAEQVKLAVKDVHPLAQQFGEIGRYDSMLDLKSKRSAPVKASKVAIAKHITLQVSQLDVLDLRAQLGFVLKFIKDSNPTSA